jgi:hypothetical protein
MAKIHVAGDGHVAPVPGTFQYLPYTDEAKRRVVERALFILRHNVRGMRPCNDCFKRLPGGRTFDDILDDPDVFIHYDPTATRGSFGATRTGTKNVTITEFSIRIGRWTVAATLVHEFAHINGAPNNTHQAEGTLPCCGFAALEVKSIIGANESSSDRRYA